MGYRCRWIAARGRDRAEVLARMQFAVAAELSEEVHDPGLYAVELDGWLVVMGDGWDFMDLVTRDQAASLSDRGEVVFLSTDDEPMTAEIASFVDGKQAWSIIYDGKPKLAGRVPDAVQSVLAEARKAQQAAGGDVDDVYDVVADVGRKLVGFRHDETLAGGSHLPIFQLAAPA